jgi:hypothetical protein
MSSVGKSLIIDTSHRVQSDDGVSIGITVTQVVTMGRPELAGESDKDRQARLCRAFDLVKDRDHWKNPVDAVIDSEHRADVEEAIMHFTGSVPSFEAAGDGLLRVRADGYYAAIGS